MSVGDVAKELGKRWALVPPDARARYDQLAAKDKERYERVRERCEVGSSTIKADRLFAQVAHIVNGFGWQRAPLGGCLGRVWFWSFQTRYGT